MKRLIQFIILTAGCFFLTAEVSAQAGIFKHEYDFPNQVTGDQQHIGTFDGGTVSIVLLYDTVSTWYYNTVVKTDANGNVQWTKPLATVSTYAGNIAQCYDSGYVITYPELRATYVTVIVKLDQTGNIIYSKHFYTPPSLTVITKTFLIPRPNGNLFVAGSVFNNVLSEYAWHIYELDNTGNILWSHGYNRNSSKNYLRDVDTMSNGDIVMLGNTFDAISSEFRTLITRITPGGIVVWSKEYATAGYHRFSVGLVCMPGDYIQVTTAMYNTMSSASEMCLMRVDGAGNELWTFKYHLANGNIEPYAITMGGNQSTVTLGMYMNGGFLLKNDSSGLMMATRAYPNSFPMSIDELNNSNYTIAGITLTTNRLELFTTNQQGVGCDDSAFTLIKTPMSTTTASLVDDTVVPLLDSATTVTTTTVVPEILSMCVTKGIAEHSPLITTIYPVPATHTITIETESAPDAIEIFDVTTKQVYANSQCSPRTIVDVTHWSSGIYFVRVIGETFSTTRKIIVE